MNICFYTNNYPHPYSGGVERVTYNLSNYFKLQGLNVFNITSGRTIHDGLLPSGTVQEKKEFINKFLRAHNIDILIDQNFQPFISHPDISEKVKIIKCYHSSIDKRHIIKSLMETFNFTNLNYSIRNLAFLINTPRRNILRKRTFLQQYIGSDKLVLLCERYKDRLCDILVNVDHNKLSVIPNAVESSLLNLPIAKKSKTIVWCGRIVHNPKNILFLARLWKALYKAFPDWNFVIIGDGIDRHLLENRLSKFKFEKVKITGLTNPYSYFKESSIFVLPSFNEGLPMVLLESMAYSCVPVVFDTCPAFNDIIISGVNGFIASDYDEKAFIRAVESMMRADLSEYRKMARDSVSKFSIDKIGMKWMILFKELLNT